MVVLFYWATSMFFVSVLLFISLSLSLSLLIVIIFVILTYPTFSPRTHHTLHNFRFVKQDLWFDSGIKGTHSKNLDQAILYHKDGSAQIVDAQARFWDAQSAKDYSAHMVFDISGLVAVPGFIDIQTNGAFGLDYTTPPEFDPEGNIFPTALLLQPPEKTKKVPRLTTTGSKPLNCDGNLNMSSTSMSSVSSTSSNDSTTTLSQAVSSDDGSVSLPGVPTGAHDLRPNADVPRVVLNLDNAVEFSKNNSKYAIKSTKPFGVSTPQMSRSQSSLRNSTKDDSYISSKSSPNSLQSSFTSNNSNAIQNSSLTKLFHKNLKNQINLNESTPSTFSGDVDDSVSLVSVNSNHHVENDHNQFHPNHPDNTAATIFHNLYHHQGDHSTLHVRMSHLHPNKARTFLNAYEDNKDDPFLGDVVDEYDEFIISPSDDIEQKDLTNNNNNNNQHFELSQPLSRLPIHPITSGKSTITPTPLTTPARSFIDNTTALQYPFRPTAFSSLLPQTLLTPTVSTPQLRSFLYKKDCDMLYVNEKLPQFGVTSICPTIISSDKETFSEAGKRVVDYMLAVELAKKEGLILRQCNMLGLHLEGPFISVPGAHNKSVLGPPKDIFNVSSIYNADLLFPFTSIVTLAPELDGALPVIDLLSKLGIVVSMGHSMATIEQAKAGIDHGAALVTHMFNAMRAFHHRDPGLIGILGATEPHKVHFSLIADGYHAHPFSVNIAHSSSPDKLILVTDSMAAMGLPDGQYRLGTQHVTMDNLRAVLTKQPASLAGAVVPLDQCVRNFVKFTNCTPVQAIAAATKAPAELLGIYPRKGSLLPGADADIVLLDPDTLEVVATIIAGQLCYVRDDVFPCFRDVE